MPVMKSATRIDRFMAKVNKLDNGCWEWKSVIDDRGRGRFKLLGRMVKAHIAAAYIFNNVPLDSELERHHTCLNNWCANPDHVLSVTSERHREIHRELKVKADA